MVHIPKKVAHIIIWGVVISMGGFLLTMFNRGYSHADFTNAGLSVSNVAPVINSHDMVRLIGMVPLNDGNPIAIGIMFPVLYRIEGTIRDDNYAAPALTAVMYRSGLVAGASCTPNAADCITLSCSYTGMPIPPAAPNFEYSCGFAANYNMDNNLKDLFHKSPLQYRNDAHRPLQLEKRQHR